MWGDADYPRGAVADAKGKLTQDIEGRPLNDGGRIVGRRLAGGKDQALSNEELDALAAAATRKEPPTTSPVKLQKDAGRYVETRDRRSGAPLDRTILLSEFGPPHFCCETSAVLTSR